MKRRIGAYVRVSTKDCGQDIENQVMQIKMVAQARGWQIDEIYKDEVSASGEKKRPAFERMMEDARKGRLTLIVFWSIDRFSREGTYETLDHLRRLDSYGCRFLSVQEQYLDTLGPFREAVIGLLAALAKLERMQHIERVKAGMTRARARGVKFGRKPKPIDITSLNRMLKDDWSISQIARAMNVGRPTIYRHLREHKKQQAEDKAIALQKQKEEVEDMFPPLDSTIQ